MDLCMGTFYERDGRRPREMNDVRTGPLRDTHGWYTRADVPVRRIVREDKRAAKHHRQLH